MKVLSGIYFLTVLIALCSCQQQESIEIEYIKAGKIYTEEIIKSKYLNASAKVETDFIEQISFERADSVYLKDNNPDKVRFNSEAVALDFTQPIKQYSPEYYTLATAYYVDKAIAYYNKVFRDKINFNTQEDYRKIKVLFADQTLFTHPNLFMLNENQPFSPSIFYHEMGHVAFWTLEEDLGVKFGGLSTLHMGLLEYFTVSLFNCPVVGERVLPKSMLRYADHGYVYPQPDSMYLRRTMQLLKESYNDEIADTSSFMNMYYHISMRNAEDYLDRIVDNHRGGMLYTNTLWRIREQLGAEKTDRLVAETILSLNDYMEQRSMFYKPDSNELLKDKLMWYDFYYGLLMKNKALHGGKNQSIISGEFEKSKFPIQKVTIADK